MVFADRLRGRAAPSARALLARAGRLSPLMSGSGKIASQPGLRGLAIKNQPAQIVTTLRDGSRIWVEPDDYIGRTVFYFGDFDPKVTWVVQRVLRPGDLFVDVGANIGLVSLLAARLVGPSGVVHAVEPQPRLAELIRRSAALNSFEHVLVHEVALSDREASVPLWLRKGHTGMATLESPFDDDGGRSIDVDTRPAAEFLAEVCSARPRLVKIDVEGHESAVMRGARTFFERSGPDVVLFEERGRPPGQQETVVALESAGYSIFAIPKAKLRMGLQPLDEAQGRIASDFVAIRHDCRAARRALGTESGFSGTR
ncbi:MAG: FkbM family methyltransferase [Actinomycetota bacterium]|nr:FkbM family methyltransferase [Actinomycetota bacterium]